MVVPSYLDNFGNMPMHRGCECCNRKSSTMTATSGSFHKWTKKEIESEIMSINKELAVSRWYNRGDLVRRLKHWMEKLERYNQFKEEFN